MNLEKLVQQAFNAVPATLRGPITFSLKRPSAATVTVAGRASEARADPRRYEALKLTGVDVRTLIFVSDTGTEPPQDAKCTWGGHVFAVKHVEGIAPSGRSVAHFVYIGR